MLGAIVCIFIFVNKETAATHISIGGERLNVFVVDNEAERAQGLMGVTDLNDKRGMLFLFPETQERSFWNKNTLISLGIIWIRDGIVIGTSTLPDVLENGILTVTSPGAVDAVLEMELMDELFQSINLGEKINF